MSARPLHDEIRDVLAQYPQSRSATLPALRLAQERYGWLPPEAFREVADALGETPAYCMAVASFYDMFHLEPVGRHLVEVCTNVSCALVGALVGGGYLGYALSWVGDGAESAEQRVVRSGAAVLACAGVLVAAFGVGVGVSTVCSSCCRLSLLGWWCCCCCCWFSWCSAREPTRASRAPTTINMLLLTACRCGSFR